MKRDSMVLFRSMTDALRKLEPVDFMMLMMCIIDYAMDDVEPEFTNPMMDALWSSFKPQIDANKRKFQAQVENGKKRWKTKNSQNEPNLAKVSQENPKKTSETQVKPYMRNEKCEMRNVLNNTSSSCACAREEDSFHIPDDVYEKIMEKMHRG